MINMLDLSLMVEVSGMLLILLAFILIEFNKITKNTKSYNIESFLGGDCHI